MAAALRSASGKKMCDMCSPKQVIAVTSCKGCLKELCRKHFNEHRDILSKDLHSVFDQHDSLLQELQIKVDRSSKPPDDNNSAHAILKQINEWEKTTIKRISKAANEARAAVECLFNRKLQLNQLKQKINGITEELKEQQESESFVETDIDLWTTELKQLTIDLNRPSTFESNPPIFEIQNIDWQSVIKICPPNRTYATSASIARNQMKTNNATESIVLQCPLCADEYPRSQMERMFLCDHTSCLDCTKFYYRTAVKSFRNAESLKKLLCYMGYHELSDDIKWDFLQYLETKLNQWFVDERDILDLYHENLFIATQDSHNKKCANPKCLGFFYTNDDNRIACIQCPHCQFQQCQQCYRTWYDKHTDMDCEKYAEWLEDNDPNDPLVQLLKYLNTACMICPKKECGGVYEMQAGGCEHFTCPKCKTEFCRICSAFFYNPKHNTICPRPNCTLKNTMHGHCFFNCFREIRDASVEEITQLLTANKINVTEELRLKPQATGPGCPVEGCQKAASVTYQNRFCDGCYKQFLCSFIWRNQIEPWTLYTEGNLRYKLAYASVTAPANAKKPALIALAKQHLTQYLGKPKKIERRSLK